MYDSTNPDWVPNLKMGYETNHTPDQERYRRLQLRKRRRMDTEDDAKEDEHLETGVACQTDRCVDAVDVACQTDVHVSDIIRMEAEFQQLKEDNQCLQTGVSDAKHQAEKASFCVESLQNNEKKLKFYTGKVLLYKVCHKVTFTNYCLTV